MGLFFQTKRSKAGSGKLSPLRIYEVLFIIDGQGYPGI